MKRIELIFDADCPNAEGARQNLRQALRAEGMKEEWVEWDRADPSAPERVQGFGSPTVLIDGRDAAGKEPGEAKSCRVYPKEGGGLAGVPPVTLLRAALRGEAPAAGTGSGGRNERLGLVAMAGSVAAAAASSACCWLPLLLVAFGASALGVGAFLAQYRPVLLAVAGTLLAAGFYMQYFRKEVCAPGSSCPAPRTRLRRLNRGMLWISAALVAGFALFPNTVGKVLGVSNSGAVSAEAATVTLDVAGMTCDGCEVAVEQALAKVPGVAGASASFAEGRAVVTLATPPKGGMQALVDAVARAGYQAKPSVEP